MTLGRLLWLIGVAFMVMVANVGITVLYMVVYGHWIDPGHDEAYYRDHVEVAAPYCSIIAGMPLMFLAGRWVGTWWEKSFAVKAALAVAVIYVVIDFALLLLAGLTAWIAMLATVSFLTKLAAAYFGGYISRGSAKGA